MSESKYAKAGVSIEAQDLALERIKAHVQKTKTDRVLSGIGSFGGLFDISFPDVKQPVLVASADGIGTKLKVAFEADQHDTVGQCLVNHCINDILVQGARPLFFMDYIATGRLQPGVVEQVVKGIATACAACSVALLGGEMAEMPGFYSEGEYDVAGFIVGMVDRDAILGADRVRPGQRLIGLASNGLHTNGYSLVRNILFEQKGLRLGDLLPGTDDTVGAHLLAIHRCYEAFLRDLLHAGRIRAMAHITGGGLIDNVPRVMPDHLHARIQVDRFEVPPIFRYLVTEGEVSWREAYQVFNMGIGMVLVVEEADAQEVSRHVREQGCDARDIGEVVEGAGGVSLEGAPGL